jgi:hypothetical protein
MPAGSGDASMGGSSGGAGADAPEEPAGPSEPCADAMIDLPTGSAVGGPCSDCLKAKCASALAVCMDDCTCVASINCLVVMNYNYTLCNTALAAIGAGNEGLKEIAACVPMMCQVCLPE